MVGVQKKEMTLKAEHTEPHQPWNHGASKNGYHWNKSAIDGLIAKAALPTVWKLLPKAKGRKGKSWSFWYIFYEDHSLPRMTAMWYCSWDNMSKSLLSPGI